uniref:Alpha-S1-casein n=1 Tax=Neovison vison TaxID=452646 RepID=A0A8C7BBN0_NEOVI
MKFLILTCLVAAALARPKLPLRHLELIQDEPDSREPTPKELREEYLSELRRQEELLREKQNKVIKNTKNKSTEGQTMEDTEQKLSSSSSSSEEAVPINTEERLRKLSKHNQQQMEAIHAQQQLLRVNENNLLQLPFPQFYQLDAFPFAAWYSLPQIMQYVAFPPSFDITKPTASESTENVDVVPEW